MAKKKLLHCPCSVAKYCGTAIQSTRLHRSIYNQKFHEFIHSKKGLDYLLSNYDGKTETVDAIHKTYKDLR